MLFRHSTATYQKTILFSVFFVVLLISILCGISWQLFGWPAFPKHRDLSPEKYTERMTLLKYFISLGFTVIGATWYLISNKMSKMVLSKQFLKLLSWAWTFIGISLLSAIIQVYLTYKDEYYWPLLVEENYSEFLSQMKHCIGLHILHNTYKMTDYSFFIGAFLLVIAFSGILHATIDMPENNELEK